MNNLLVFVLKDNSNREDELNQTTITVYEVPEDMSLMTYHRYCKNFALAMGYADASVERVFGETQWDD